MFSANCVGVFSPNCVSDVFQYDVSSGGLQSRLLMSLNRSATS